MPQHEDNEVPQPQALIFDLGGVVLDLDFRRVFERWGELSGVEPSDLQARWRFDAAYERHERGEIDASRYFGGLRSTLQVDLTIDEFVDGWNCVHLGPVPGIESLLADLATRFPLYALTNSNPSHVACWSQRYRELLSVFGAIYISSTMGVRKPEPESYLLVAETVGLPADAFHFFDDSEENITGARRVGMPATHVASANVLVAATTQLTRGA